jgi:hypothetical protein
VETTRALWTNDDLLRVRWRSSVGPEDENVTKDLYHTAETHLDTGEEVVASREAANEEQSIDLSVDFLRLFFDEVDNLVDHGLEDFSSEKITRNDELAVGQANGWLEGRSGGRLGNDDEEYGHSRHLAER